MEAAPQNRVWGRTHVELDAGVRAEVVRGRREGPTVWIWVPAGGKAPQLVIEPL